MKMKLYLKLHKNVKFYGVVSYTRHIDMEDTNCVDKHS
jgi:hypothetical protein